MKYIKLLYISIISLTVIFVGFTACDTASTDQIEGNGRLTVQLTDAPADFDAVFIDIQRIRVNRNEDAETDSTESDEEAEEEGFITIMDQPVRVNLLDLRNGNTIQLGDEELEIGEYNQIRLILGSDNEVVIDGESSPLKTPSAQQSGLKLLVDFEIEEGEIFNLLIDFDAGRSVVETGNGMFILKPVLRAVELEETGAISGVVQPDSIQTSVLAITNGDTLSTLTEDGEFAIIGVSPETYDVFLGPNSDAFADTTLSNIAVEDENVDLGTITLEEL